jgi:hypothetical protein
MARPLAFSMQAQVIATGPMEITLFSAPSIQLASLDYPADLRSSRLGCQVHMSKDVDGLIATLPSATRNMYVDGQSSLSFSQQGS